MKTFIGWVLSAVILYVFCFLGYKYLLTEEITVRVADINKGEFVSLCIVGETTKTGCDEYTNNDDWWYFKRDSGKIRSRLAMAETDSSEIKVKVQGVRITLFSIRKNIIKIVD